MTKFKIENEIRQWCVIFCDIVNHDGDLNGLLN